MPSDSVKNILLNEEIFFDKKGERIMKVYLLVGRDYFKTTGIALYSKEDDAKEHRGRLEKKNAIYPVCQREYSRFDIIPMDLETIKIDEES